MINRSRLVVVLCASASLAFCLSCKPPTTSGANNFGNSARGSSTREQPAGDAQNAGACPINAPRPNEIVPLLKQPINMCVNLENPTKGLLREVQISFDFILDARIEKIRRFVDTGVIALLPQVIKSTVVLANGTKVPLQYMVAPEVYFSPVGSLCDLRISKITLGLRQLKIPHVPGFATGAIEAFLDAQEHAPDGGLIMSHASGPVQEAIQQKLAAFGCRAH